MAGLMHDLLGRQHSAGLEQELVQGWTGKVYVVTDLNENWSPPEGRGEYKIIEGFHVQLKNTQFFG